MALHKKALDGRRLTRHDFDSEREARDLYQHSPRWYPFSDFYDVPTASTFGYAQATAGGGNDPASALREVEKEIAFYAASREGRLNGGKCPYPSLLERRENLHAMAEEADRADG